MKNTLGTLRKWCLAVALVAFWPSTAGAQIWTAATPNTYGAMIALDGDNNAYVAGYAPMATILLTKYSPSGMQLWQRMFDNPVTREESSWVTVDPAGNAIVTGRIVDTSGNPNGLIVLKYDASGALLWQDVIPSAFGYASRASTDGAGNVYVLGRAWQANASGNTTHDIVTIKYAPNGARQWMRNFGLDSTSVDSPASMAVTATGNVIVTGGTVGNMLMAAYDPSGNQLWSKAVPANTAGLDVAIGKTGEFYVVGGTSSATGQAFLIVKHDANFNEIWRKTYAVGHYGMRAAVDSFGNLIVTGITGNYFNWMTIKLDPNGTLLWSRTYDQHRYNDEIPYSMVVGPGDQIYITGQGGPAPASVLGDASLLSTVTLRYLADGGQVWSRTTGETVRGVGIKVGSDGNVFVLGQSPQTLINYGVDLSMNIPPTAMATANPTTGTAPMVVNFSSADSTDPDGFGVPLRYWWDFGDGTGSIEANPSHTYSAVGSFIARLTVTDRIGGAETATPITITSVAPPPTPTSLTLASTTVRGGGSTKATVRVSSSVGVTVTLASSNASVASVPASVAIPAGATSTTFTVKTSKVRTNTTVMLQATANGVVATGSLTVTK